MLWWPEVSREGRFSFIESISGWYRDKEGASHSVFGVEVYLPWNDTWLDLPPLPDLGGGYGRMDRTRLMFLSDVAGGVPLLYLLGGSTTIWSHGVDASDRRVWILQWDTFNHTYSWSDRDEPLLGG